MKKIIHVNQANIRSNKKNGTNLPVLTVKTYRDNLYTDEVIIHGPSRLIYSPDKPLSCGARVWLEAYCPVEVKRPRSVKEVCKLRSCPAT